MSDSLHALGDAAATAPSTVRAWWLAARPHTLGASLVPVLVGICVAARLGELRPLTAAACLLTALLLQIATNLANDALDFVSGVDTAERLGPRRAAQSGWLSWKQVFGGALLAVAVAMALGVHLVWVGGAPILWIGLASVVAALGYSGGPFPLASHGLGEAAAFVFFGVIAVSGSAYLHLDRFDPGAIAASIPIALLVSAIMAVNNLRDIESDARSGKRTLAVRIGAPAARHFYTTLILGSLLWTFPLAAWLGSPWLLLPLASAPLACALVKELRTARGGPEFNAALAHTARLHAVYGLLLCVGILC